MIPSSRKITLTTLQASSKDACLYKANKHPNPDASVLKALAMILK